MGTRLRGAARERLTPADLWFPACTGKAQQEEGEGEKTRTDEKSP